MNIEGIVYFSQSQNLTEESDHKQQTQLKGLLAMLCLFFMASNFAPTYAQDIEIDEDGEIHAGEIVIEKDRKIVLPQSRKIYQKIKSLENKTVKSYISNDFKTFNYNPEVKVPNLRIAKPKSTGKKDEIYDHFVKVGYGNFASPLLQADLNLITDKTKSFRVNFDHQSFGKGAKDGKNSASSYTNGGINGKVIGDGVTLTTGLDYTSTTDHFYGYQPGLVINKSDIRHKYNYFSARLGLEDNDVKNDFDYNLFLAFSSMKDNFSAKENGITIGAGFNYDKQIYVDTELIFTKYTQATFDQSRSFLRVNPFYRFDAGEAKIDLGFSFTSIAGGVETFGSSTIFPFARVKYAIAEQVNLFATLDGGMSFNSYANYVSENRYLRNDLEVQNSRVNYDFKAGAGIKPYAGVSITPYFQLQSIKNFGMYLNILPDTTSFTIGYIPGNTTKVEFGSRLQISIDDKNQIGLNAAVLSYSSKDAQDLYHLPSSKIELLGTHRVIEKLKFNWDFNLLSGIKALESNGPSEGSETTANLSAITELNANLDYQINDRTGAFLQVNNILNKNYERYLNYPMRGLQVKIGASLRF